MVELLISKGAPLDVKNKVLSYLNTSCFHVPVYIREYYGYPNLAEQFYCTALTFHS